MKNLFCILGICLIITSCTSSLYYQMYQTKALTNDITVNDDAIVFEDDNCIISYDFWGENGDIGFDIYNKNSENLYLHLDECFFVKNGYAYDYYQNRIYSSSSTSVLSASISYTSGSFSAAEKRIICIPPQSSKIVSEYTINEQPYKDCDIVFYPGKKDNNTLDFTKENSPFVFGNILAYSIGDSETLNRIYNDFYVSKISNYPLDVITTEVPQELCGKQLQYKKERVFKNSGPDQFYIQYNYDYRYDDKPDNPMYYDRYY